MDLDFWDCFGRKKTCHITEEIWYSQLLMSQSLISSKASDIFKYIAIFWSQKIYLNRYQFSEIKGVEMKIKNRKCVQTIFFDIRRYFEISVFEIPTEHQGPVVQN